MPMRNAIPVEFIFHTGSEEHTSKISNPQFLISVSVSKSFLKGCNSVLTPNLMHTCLTCLNPHPLQPPPPLRPLRPVSSRRGADDEAVLGRDGGGVRRGGKGADRRRFPPHQGPPRAQDGRWAGHGRGGDGSTGGATDLQHSALTIIYLVGFEPINCSKLHAHMFPPPF